VERRHPRGRTNLAIVRSTFVVAASVLMASFVSVANGSSPEWSFPPCPTQPVISPFSASESPTRAIVAQDWFRRLQQATPAAVTPTSLMALPANEPVTVCRIEADGKATDGLGAVADVGVMVVTKSSSELVALVDSKMFEVYLPSSHTAEIGANPPPPDTTPQWPVRVTADAPPNDRAIHDALVSNTYSTSDEILAARIHYPDQPGLARVDRLVFGDSCGTVGIFVRIQNGILRPFLFHPSQVSPLTCGANP
jgi:hypothetical protein